MRLMVLALIAMLAAFAPPARGTRYVFEVADAAGQAGAVDAMRKRVEAAGINASVEPKGPVRIEVHAARTVAQEKITRLLSRPGIMTFNLVDSAADVDDYPLFEARNNRTAKPNLSDKGAPLVIEMDSILTGEQVESAKAEIDPYTSQPAIQIRLKPNGARAFGAVTTQSVGRQLAIVVDDQIMLAPFIRMPITAGFITLTGAFTMAEAQEYAAALQAPLPGLVKLIEIGTYGPGQ